MTKGIYHLGKGYAKLEYDTSQDTLTIYYYDPSSATYVPKVTVKLSTGDVTISGKLTVAQKGVNVSVSASATSLAVTLPKAESDTNYGVLVVPQWNTTVWITNKTTTGFTINFGTAPSSNSALDWFVFR